LLPSGPGGVRRIPLRGAQPSTPSRTAHSTRSALEKEFNPAVADCGLQGTATSPSSTAKLCRLPACEVLPASGGNGGGGGIRTHGTVARTRHFQCRTFGHSATPPQLSVRNWRRGEDLNPRGTCAPIRFRVGRLQPGSATPPRLMSRSLPQLTQVPKCSRWTRESPSPERKPHVRFALKNSWRRAAHSGPRMPAATSTR
jgi:hypothetical protein